MTASKLARIASKIAMYVAAGMIGVMMLLVSADVAGRYFFNSPIRGTIEVVELSLVVVVFFGLSRTQAVGEHVRIDILLDRLHGGTRKAFEVASRLVGAALFSLVAWRSVVRAVADWQSGLHSDLLKVPIYYLKIVIAVGCLLLLLELLVECADLLTARRQT